MSPIRCGLIGHGMIGREHARILVANPGAELVVVCDTDSGVDAPAGIRFTTSLEDALDTPGLEAVWVCTPQHVHRPVVEAALSRDLAVFCEKPMASSLEDADAMIRAADASRGSLVIGHTLRFDPDYVAVKDAVSAGKLGRLAHLAARWNAPDYEGTVISGRTTVPLEMMIHDLDIMVWLAGEIEQVFGFACGFGVTGPGPDAAVGVVRFRSGAVGALDHNWIMPAASGVKSDHRLAVFGSEGTAYVESRETPAVVFSSGETNYLKHTYYSYPNGMPFGALPSEDAYFLAMIEDGRSWPLTLQDARAALVAALAMDRSIAEARPVNLDEITAEVSG